MEKKKKNGVQSRTIRVLLLCICLLLSISIPVGATQYDPPRASNYDFDYPYGPDSTPCASDAADHQDEALYDGRSYTNSAAIPAWEKMADDAIFSFVGHGDNGVISFWDGDESGYILADYYVNYSYPTDTSDYKYLSNYSTELSDLLHAAYISCNSANESSEVGNLTSYSYQKGVDTTLGFLTNIGAAQACDFSWKYWYNLAIYNWTVSTSADSAKYYAAVYNGGQFEGIQNYVIVGNPQLTIKPARYGS